MLRFRIGEQVIVSDHGVKKLGIITAQATKQKLRVYNVRMENGTEHHFLKIDSFDSDYHINSYLSKRLGSLVDTNLTINNTANFKK